MINKLIWPVNDLKKKCFFRKIAWCSRVKQRRVVSNPVLLAKKFHPSHRLVYFYESGMTSKSQMQKRWNQFFLTPYRPFFTKIALRLRVKHKWAESFFPSKASPPPIDMFFLSKLHDMWLKRKRGESYFISEQTNTTAPQALKPYMLLSPYIKGRFYRTGAKS